ncbi:MAG TPA: FKBP-type peptidyl-prolyl cis-trans isomerase [Propionibacteriaceae bacterium]|nr:FKBP-type peptidyl-prolyl cis-trans isomerase [Propionibacteriaceae bacterium]
MVLQFPSRAVRGLARPLAVVAALSLLLTACSDSSADSTATPSASTSVSASASSSPTATPKPIASLDAITVKGDYGKAPTVTGPWPGVFSKSSVKVLKAGAGATLLATDSVEVNYYGVNARTGSTFDQSFKNGSTVTFSLDGVIQGFKQGLVGQKVGSRVLIGITGKDGYDSSGGSARAGIEVGDSLVFVVDIVSATLTGPEGTAVAPKAGLPIVVDTKGVPTVTIPKAATRPTKTVVQPLIKGKGKAVTATDAITANYTMVSWSSGKVLSSNYADGPETGALSGLVSSWKGLVGQTVGSRVMIVVPAATDYPSGASAPPVTATDTLVYVIDILQVVPTQ